MKKVLLAGLLTIAIVSLSACGGADENTEYGRFSKEYIGSDINIYTDSKTGCKYINDDTEGGFTALLNSNGEADCQSTSSGFN